MIATIKNTRKVRPEKLGGKLLTLPGLYVKPYEALQQYTDRSTEEKMAQSYKDEGIPIPNFEMMDKIERLEALGEWQAKAQELKRSLDERNKEAKAEHDKRELDSIIKAKISEHEQSKQGTASTNT